MKRPEWAASGTFAEAWRQALWTAQQSRVPWHRKQGDFVLSGLAVAHVVTISSEQVAVLPDEFDCYEASAAAFLDTRLPFDPLYLSLDKAPLRRFEPPGRVWGVLVGTPRSVSTTWDGRQPVICPFVESGSGIQEPTWESVCWATAQGWNGYGLVDDLESDLRERGASDRDMEDGRSVRGDVAEIVAKVIYFLESANVELVEAVPTRQERRAVGRKGGQIALTVAVRQPKRRAQATTGQLRQWSHRWEVRGHYKHFPVGTKLADARPERLVSHPSLGQCRRIWCPPHVKGPQDRPLVPKVRVVVDERL